MDVIVSWFAILTGLVLVGALLDRRPAWRPEHRVLLGVAIVLVVFGAYGMGWLG